MAGALGVQNAADRLERACQADKENIDRELKTVLSELKIVLEGLENLDQNPPDVIPKMAADVDTDEMKALIHELYALVNDNDTQAIEVVHRLSPLIQRTDQTEFFRKIIIAVEGYDFDTAKDLLKKKGYGQ